MRLWLCLLSICSVLALQTLDITLSETPCLFGSMAWRVHLPLSRCVAIATNASVRADLVEPTACRTAGRVVVRTYSTPACQREIKLQVLTMDRSCHPVDVGGLAAFASVDCHINHQAVVRPSATLSVFTSASAPSRDSRPVWSRELVAFALVLGWLVAVAVALRLKRPYSGWLTLRTAFQKRFPTWFVQRVCLPGP
jgi:hypothetical protein